MVECNMLFTLFAYLIILFVKCSATTSQNENTAELNNKYCDIQLQVCNNSVHPLCPKFNSDHLSPTIYHFYELHEKDNDFILNTINTFRNDLAAGKIAGRPERGSNIHAVRWSDDYVELMKAKIVDPTVCTEISLTGQVTLELAEFSDSSGNQKSELNIFANRVVNDSPWIDLFRAEFDQIGCVYYDYACETRNFTCYVNRYGPTDGNVTTKELYKYGAPCSHCDAGCSKRWPNLCDNTIQVTRIISLSTLIMSYAMRAFGVSMILILSVMCVMKFISKCSKKKEYTISRDMDCVESEKTKL